MKKISALFYDERYQGVLILATIALLVAVITGTVLL